MNHYAFAEMFGASDPGYKTYRKGTHRTIAPTDTVARLRSMMPELGITRVANVTGLDRIGIPGVGAGDRRIGRGRRSGSATAASKGCRLAY